MTLRLTIAYIRHPADKCQALPGETYEKQVAELGREGDQARCRREALVTVQGVKLCRAHAAECVLAELFEGNEILVGPPA